MVTYHSAFNVILSASRTKIVLLFYEYTWSMTNIGIVFPDQCRIIVIAKSEMKS